MEPLFLLVVAGIVAAVIFGASKSRSDALNRSWNRAAEQLGVSLTPGAWNASPRLEGNISGYPLTIDIEKRRTGKHRTAYTRFRLGGFRLPAGTELKREGFLSGISKAFGVKDIETGDAAFDSQVHVRAHDAGAMREFLTPIRRRNVSRFLESHSGAVVDGEGISWSSRGRMRDSARVLDTVEAMLDLARVLAGDEIQSAREASAVEPKVEATVSKDSEAEWGALAAATGVPAAAWATAATHESAAGPGHEAERAEPDGAAAFCTAVFKPGTMSFEATKTFDSDYKGRRVSWTGTLRSAEPYRFDFVFGAGPAMKATLVLPASGSGAVGNGGVKAVISLAEADGLESRIGQRVGFTGTLFKVDGFSRSVFLTEAALE